MSKLTLYHFPLSPNAIKVVAALRHMGLDFDEATVDLPKGETHRPDFLALNPNGKVPVLRDGDFLLWESNSILRYLAEREASDLVPADPRQRADMNRWMDWQLAHWTPAVGHLTFERLAPAFIPGYAEDKPAQERASALLERYAPVLDAHLAGRTWLVGESVTLADLAVASQAVHRRMAGLSLDRWPNLSAWLDRVEALPSYRAAVPAMPTPA